jgi:hypothetical protein
MIFKAKVLNLQVEKQMKADVHGELVPLSTIPEFSDIKAIKKVSPLKRWWMNVCKDLVIKSLYDHSSIS